MVEGVPPMRIQVLGILVVAIVFADDGFAQTSSPDGWLNPDWTKPAISAANRKPAPRRSLRGMSRPPERPRRRLAGMGAPAEGPGAGAEAQGVQLKPNNGRPENELPYTPYGRQLYDSHRALEGKDA